MKETQQGGRNLVGLGSGLGTLSKPLTSWQTEAATLGVSIHMDVELAQAAQEVALP